MGIDFSLRMFLWIDELKVFRLSPYLSVRSKSSRLYFVVSLLQSRAGSFSFSLTTRSRAIGVLNDK
jgi:hypothetical protein